MPPLRYLWAATKLPKDEANFTWQHSAAPEGGRGSRQRWIYPLAQVHVSYLVFVHRETNSFLLPTNSGSQRAELQSWKKTTALATRTAPCPSFSSRSRLQNEPDVFPTDEKACSREDTLRNAFWTE